MPQSIINYVVYRILRKYTELNYLLMRVKGQGQLTIMNNIFWPWLQIQQEIAYSNI